MDGLRAAVTANITLDISVNGKDSVRVDVV